ncbi:unnamed protein product [Orchesella dallaii]|uniref:Uncharacterized protein n=1 Tax=Orchesella dallaii TaxID=48710 RepID=A0ABP1RP63_9HEXA
MTFYFYFSELLKNLQDKINMSPTKLQVEFRVMELIARHQILEREQGGLEARARADLQRCRGEMNIPTKVQVEFRVMELIARDQIPAREQGGLEARARADLQRCRGEYQIPSYPNGDDVELFMETGIYRYAFRRKSAAWVRNRAGEVYDQKFDEAFTKLVELRAAMAYYSRRRFKF